VQCFVGYEHRETLQTPAVSASVLNMEVAVNKRGPTSQETDPALHKIKSFGAVRRPAPSHTHTHYSVIY
jgi:hypothetical protein